MPYRFVPPVAPLVPTTVRVNHPAHSLFRHYRPWDAGLNVFLLVGGVLTESEPADPELIEQTFHGGHIHTVDDDTAALLIEAGYTVQSVTLEPPAPGLPGGDYTSPPVGTLQDVYSDTYTDFYGASLAALPAETYTDNYAEAY